MISIEVGDQVEFKISNPKTVTLVDSDGFIGFSDGRLVHKSHLANLLKVGTIKVLKRATAPSTVEPAHPDQEPWPHPIFPC